MKKTRILALTALLAAAMLFSACDLLTEPFPDETYGDTAPSGPDAETVSHIPAEGTIPNYGTEIPIETAVETDIFSDETTPASDIRELWGTVVEYKAQEPMTGVIAVQVYTTDGQKTMHLLVENPADFCVGDEVVFTYDANAEVMDSYDGHPVWAALTIEYAPIAFPEKPVIYLYPESPTEVSVKLTIDGELTCTYPAYEKGWNSFTAYPDGTLLFPDGKEYYCLYWEGIQNMECDFSTGFCVKGSDTAEFLEWALAEQGLTPREANEFIIYWLPRMEQNPYNVISFQTEAYTDGAVLDIQPNPDSLLRVFMAWYPSHEAVEMEAQEFATFERVGFTVVEWGGCELIEAP